MPETLDFEKRVQDALQLPDEKKFYFNGYTFSITATDIIIVIQKDDQPIAYLNTSHTIAKTLVKAMTKLIENFEKDTQHPILTLSEYEERLKNAASARDRTENKSI